MNDDNDGARRERVLVIDDSRQIRDFLADYILKPHGFEVLMAADGIEGLRLAFDEHPDLMIVDVQMPSMGGLDLLRRLQLRRLNIPTILITSYGSEQVAVDALRLGVRDYVLKPFDVQQMEEAIQRAMREKRLAGAKDELTYRVTQQDKHLRQIVRQVNGLYSFSRFLATTSDVEAIVQRAVEVAAFICQADLSVLFVLDKLHGELVLRAAHNTSAAYAPRSLKSSAAAHVLRTRQTTVLDSSAARKVLPDGPAVHNLAYVPLVAGTEAIGVLSIATNSSDNALSQRDRRLLAILASLTAQSLRYHEGNA
ncbi:MAG: response regulator [Anaerolineae bacterium]|nr:response regulator [Anaerolineae bacterium]